MTTYEYRLGQFRRALLMAFVITAIVSPARLRAQVGADTTELGEVSVSQARATAERELESARAAVAEARAAATAAKRALDAALSRHILDQKAASSRPSSAAHSRGADTGALEPAAKSTDDPAVKSAVTKAASDHINVLKKRIQNLTSERAELLTRMTKAHPLIVDADLRLEEYEQQLAALIDGRAGSATLPRATSAKPVEPPVTADSATHAEPATTNPSQADTERVREASLRLEEALAKWETAMRSLASAIYAESSAAERLASISARPPAHETLEPAAPQAASPVQAPAVISPPAVAVAAPVSKSSQGKGSQPLVLAALIIALVVAALASVKLARSSHETVFAGADEAAATLALPVVGVIPALSPAFVRRQSHRVRALTVVGQMLIAVAVFAAIAYCVQNPEFLWNLCTDPLEVLRGMGQ